MAYLFYVPFCKVFISDDGLHARTVPLFLEDDQALLTGDELKADLANLNRYYSAMAPEELEKGIYKFAPHPPLDDNFLTTRLWDRFFPGWREQLTRKAAAPTETKAELLAKLRQMDDAQPDESGGMLDTDSLHFLTVSRSVPVKKGKWRLIPREAEEANNKSS